MATIFIIHGAYGNPQENWFPWLKKELENLGHTVIVPQFPTPENQTLENWLKVFSRYEKNIHEDTIMIGHSIGAAFILNFLAQKEKKIKAAFFVAGFAELLGNPTFDSINNTFMSPFDWKKIRQHCTKFFVYHADNDPYVPLRFGEQLAKQLHVKLILVKNAGHFNERAGYLKFPQLLEDVKQASWRFN